MCKAICDPAASADAPVDSKAAETTSTQVAREVISAILLRLVSSSQCLAATDARLNFNATDVAVGHEVQLGLEVCWMASGNTACLVQTSANMCVSDVKAQVLSQAKVPMEEQRLFASGKELSCDGDVPLAPESQLMLVRSVSDPRVTNLGRFRVSSKFEDLNPAGFTMVRRVSAGINGDIFKYQWRHGQSNTEVAVKKLRNQALQQLKNTETDERIIHMNPRCRAPSNEDALTEIGVLSYLSKQQDLPLYLLKMLGVYAEDRFTWLLTEFADGGELFDVAAAGGLAETQIQEYMWQMLQATEYLHCHRIGHRDISLENVLLKGGLVRLMDYGMAVASHSPSGTALRYYREVGKHFYRAPECYVPAHGEVTVTAPIPSGPGDVIMARVAPNFLCEVRLPADFLPGQACKADVWGYAVTPADVFALGVCMFILAFQCPAWEFAKLSNRFFAHVYNSHEKGLESLLKMWGKQQVLSPDAMQMMSEMLRADPAKRPSAADCLSHSWFDNCANRRVPMHADQDN